MSKKRVNVVTMGCSKNLVDSEVLLNQLEKGKFEVEHDSNGTDSMLFLSIPVVLFTMPSRNLLI